MSKSKNFPWKSPDKHTIAEGVCQVLISEFDNIHRGKVKIETLSQAVILSLFYIKLRNDGSVRTKGTYESFKTAVQIGVRQRLLTPSKEQEACLLEVIDFNRGFLEEHSAFIEIISEQFDKLQNDMYSESILSDEWISENTGVILEVWLAKFSQDSTSTFSFQPGGVTDLIVDLTVDLRTEWRSIDPSKDRPIRVYNPFAGLSSYPVSLRREISNIDFISQELDPATHYLAILRLFCNDVKLFYRPALDGDGNRVDLYIEKKKSPEDLFESIGINPAYKKLGSPENIVEHGDSMHIWPTGSFDLVICSPPIFTKHDQYEDSTAPEFVLRKSLQSLESGGLLAVLLPSNSEHTTIDKAFRKDAVDSGFLRHVLRLPNRTLKGTSISLTAYIFKKSKSGNVQFTDLSDELFHHKDSRDQIHFDNKLAKKAIEIEEGNVSIQVSTDKIKDEGYILSPLRYLIDDTLPTPGNGTIHVTLREVLKDKREARVLKVIDSKSGAVYLTDSSLRAINGFHITIENVRAADNGIADQRQRTWRKIVSPSVLVTSRGNTVCRYIDKEVLLTNVVYVDNSIRSYDFKPQGIELELDFLLWKLNSPNFQNRKRKYEYGYAVPVISARDFLEMKIEVSPLQFQRNQLLELKETSKVYQASIDAANRNIELLQKSTYSVFSDFAHLNHSVISPKFLTISSIVHNLDDLLKQDIDGFTQMRKELGDSSIQENLQKIKDYILDIGEVLKKVGKSTKTLDVSLAPLGIKDFVEHLRLKIDIGLDLFPRIEREMPIEFLNTDFDEDEFEGLRISTNLPLVTTLCENILNNAREHAFQSSPLDYSDRRVVLSFDYSADFVFLTIKNNGVPFDKDITQAEFSAAGKTSKVGTNTGLGGFDVNRIASYLGDPYWELINDPENEYPVQFKFKFPILKDLKYV
jgi:type I restriction enzyme M protein